MATFETTDPKEESLQDLEAPIEAEIAAELVALTPETWNRILLRVVCSESESGEGRAHEISAPDGQTEPVAPSEQLFGGTFRLRELFGRFGRRWREMDLEVEVRRDATRYSVKYVY